MEAAAQLAQDAGNDAPPSQRQSEGNGTPAAELGVKRYNVRGTRETALGTRDVPFAARASPVCRLMLLPGPGWEANARAPLQGERSRQRS